MNVLVIKSKRFKCSIYKYIFVDELLRCIAYIRTDGRIEARTADQNDLLFSINDSRGIKTYFDVRIEDAVLQYPPPNVFYHPPKKPTENELSKLFELLL